MTLISNELRRTVFERAGGRCEYCHLSQDTQVSTFPIDHVVPRSVGGKTEADNLALACPRCNAAKWIHTSATDSETGESTRLFDPRRDIWSGHFRWANDLAWLEAITPEARVAIELLDLNSAHRRQIRQWLVVLGLHP
jgi:5-methylcytosine-specific restriction endonuclease McrA